MADKGHPIPVELLLSHIGKQVKVDIAAHRARLTDDIEKKRQRLAELRARRAEVAEISQESLPDVEDEALPPPLPTDTGLFKAAAELADTGAADDWLFEDIAEDSQSPAIGDLAPDPAFATAANEGEADVWSDLPTSLTSPAETSLELELPDLDLDDLWSVDEANVTPSPDTGALEAGLDEDEGNDWVNEEELRPKIKQALAETDDTPVEPDVLAAQPVRGSLSPVPAMGDLLDEVAQMDPDLLDDWEF